MKKLLLTIFSLPLCAGAFAQFSVGPEAGLLFSNYTGKSNGETVNTKPVFGARFGATADLGLGSHFAVQSGLLYVINGYQLDYFILSQKVTINTLEVPLNVFWKSGEPGDDRFFVGVGPYIGWNMSGKYKETGNGASETRSLNIGDKVGEDDSKRTDYGIGVNLGYQLSMGLFIRAHFQKGLANLQPGGNADNIAQNMNYGISFGYLFGGHDDHHR